MLCGSYSVAKRWGIGGGESFWTAAVQQKLTPARPKIAPRLHETPILTILGNPGKYASPLLRFSELGPCCCHLASILAPSWLHLEAIFGPSWAIFGPSWLVFGRLEPS